MEESQRQNIVMAFNNVLRTSTLVGHIDLQRTSLAFSALLDNCAPGAPVPLGPIYDFLLEQKAHEPTVREVIVFLKSREARYGVEMELPPQLQALTPDDIQKLVTTFTQRGATSGTFAGKSIDPKTPTANPQAPAANPGKSTSSGMPTRNKLVVVLGLMLIAWIASVVVDAATAPPPPVPVVLNDPAGLPCIDAIANHNIVVCNIHKAWFDSNSKAVLQSKAAITKAAVRAQGNHRLMVITVEDQQLVLSQ